MIISSNEDKLRTTNFKTFGAFPDVAALSFGSATSSPADWCFYTRANQETILSVLTFVVILNPQELEQCLLEKEEELRTIQSRAAEMEQELHTALQEKQVNEALSFRE